MRKHVAFLLLVMVIAVFGTILFDQYDADDLDICGPSLVQAEPSTMFADDTATTNSTGTVLRVGNSECKVGDRTGTIGIYMEGAPEISILNFTVTFNPDHFTPTEIVFSDLLVIQSYSISDNVCNFEFVSKNRYMSVTSTGLLATISYESNDEASCGTYPVLVNKLLSKNGDSRYVQVQCISGTVLITGVAGDIDGDGKVSLTDSLQLRYILSGNQTKSIGCADMDNDGKIDSSDSLLLRKYLAAWDVDMTPAYGFGDNSASIFGYYVGGIGYGPLYINSTEMFAVIKDGSTSSFAHDIGDSYYTDIRPDVGLVIKDGSSIQSYERSITYFMNGGNFDCSMPLLYKPGDTVDLGCPTNDDSGMMFMGWYTDSDCTRLMLYIPSSCTTNLHLYALWSDTVIGHGFSMGYHIDVSGNGTVSNPSYSVDGTLETTYWAYDQSKGYLIRDFKTFKVDDEEQRYTDDVDWQVSGSEVEVTDNGIVQINIDGWKVSAHKYTSVSEGGKLVEKQYVIYGWLPLKIEIQSDVRNNVFTASYVLSGILNFEVQDTYAVTVYTGHGISATGSSAVAIGDEVTLTAKAITGSFGGWYDAAGNLLSTSKTFNLGKVISDVVLIARNNEPYDAYYADGEDVEMESPDNGAVWTMINLDTSEIEKQSTGSGFYFENKKYGYYELLVSGTDEDSIPFNEAWFFLLDETITKYYTWNLLSWGTTQTLSLDIPYSDLIAYRNSDIDRAPGIFNPLVEYVTYEDPTVVALAQNMKSRTAGMSDYDVLDYVLCFVQVAIPYQLDDVGMGVSEYWKYPVETLYDGKGDCEDTAILYCAITKAMGYDSALLTFYGHAASGINIKELGFTSSNVEKVKCSDGYNQYCYYLKVNNQRITYVYPCSNNYYFYCETTTSGWHVGDYSGDLNYPEYSYYSSLNVIRVVRVV